MREPDENIISEQIGQAHHHYDDLDTYIKYNETGEQPPVPTDQILSEIRDCLGFLIATVDTLIEVVKYTESECEGRMTDAEIFDACFRELVRRW